MRRKFSTQDEIAKSIQFSQLTTDSVTTSAVEFPSTEVADANGNTLDDYEEGGWTPGVTFGGNSVGITYLSNYGYYVKIGKMVLATGYISFSSKGSSTGNASITGLPFAGLLSAIAIFFSKITFANQLCGYVNSSSTTILLNEMANAGGVTAITNADFANDSVFFVSAVYRSA
jgi:hypothetical protein